MKLRPSRPNPDSPLGNLDLLLAAASGLLLGLAFPKAGLWPLAWVGLIPLFLALEGVSPRRAFLLGYACGAVQFGVILYWISYVTTTYGGMTLAAGAGVCALLVLYLALYPGLFGLGLALTGRAGWPLWLVAPPLWVGLERLRGVAFTGFPWAELGASQFPWLTFIQAADLGGVALLSFVVVLVNVALAQLSWRPAPRQLVPALVALVVLALSLLYGEFRLRQVDRLVAAAPRLPVAVVQGNIEQSLKWRDGLQDESIGAYRDLTRAALRGSPPELVIWPETALPFYFLLEEEHTPAVMEFLKGLPSHLLLGSPAYEVGSGGEVSYFNRAYLFGPAGRLLAHYDKVHLVPWGEYVPLKRYLPFMGTAVPATIGNFEAGRFGLLEMDGQGAARIGVLICFESIFSDLAREAAGGGATLLANLTNDAWFGTTSAPYQHFSQSVLRAVETKRAVVRAANTGISGLIGPDGRVLASTRLQERTQLGGSVPLLDVTTIYTKIGNTWAWGCLAWSAGLAAWAARRRT